MNHGIKGLPTSADWEKVPRIKWRTVSSEDYNAAYKEPHHWEEDGRFSFLTKTIEGVNEHGDELRYGWNYRLGKFYRTVEPITGLQMINEMSRFFGQHLYED
jgi:hypothetical protein